MKNIYKKGRKNRLFKYLIVKVGMDTTYLYVLNYNILTAFLMMCLL